MRFHADASPRGLFVTVSLLLACFATMTHAQEGKVQACIPRPSTTTSVPAAPSAPASVPKNFGMLIFRAYEMLDVFGPLDALGVLARMYQLNLYLISNTMDPVTVEPTSPAMNSKNSSFFPVLLPTHTYATAPKDIEVLMIPGGLWTRSPNLNDTIAYVRESYPNLKYLISICTGASIAARAGVLDGRRATTNKASWASTIVHGPNVTWVPKARWVVDGNVWSSSGVSAGIDATLAFISEVYGKNNATYIADMMEYDWHTDSSWDPFSEKFNVTGAGAA
ncbi:dj-1 family protein [Colletotrichum truncatum]|uniref:Dj-1 family protein n=1 Tax=Colletotrichum truncatum TaxID=5467 RepID=A0ACC3ZIH1_COLTU|nr:dj-1 family protein [Colletotrichum truncatum]KAF6791748.1 dj-1 family protein [Colletotrichum truncatum]